MGFFKKIGKGLKNAAKWTSKKAMPVVSKVSGAAAGVAALVPGIGTAAGAALAGVSVGSRLLSSKPSLSSIGDAAQLAGNFAPNSTLSKGLLSASNSVTSIKQSSFASMFNTSKPSPSVATPPPAAMVETPYKSPSPVVTAANLNNDYPAIANVGVKQSITGAQVGEIVGNMIGAGWNTAQSNGAIKTGDGTGNPVVDGAKKGFLDQMSSNPSLKKYILLAIGALVAVALFFGKRGQKSAQRSRGRRY